MKEDEGDARGGARVEREVERVGERVARVGGVAVAAREAEGGGRAAPHAHGEGEPPARGVAAKHGGARDAWQSKRKRGWQNKGWRGEG